MNSNESIIIPEIECMAELKIDKSSVQKIYIHDFLYAHFTRNNNLLILQIRLREDRTRFNLNLEVQLMLKQGQVEVDAGSFIHEYKDSALLHRSVVEDLNHTIKVRTLSFLHN